LSSPISVLIKLILEKKLEESIKKEEYEKAGILKAEIKSLQQAQQ